ncbi:hypothetical protein QAD02_016902 [Eretmocerus hayati]|uniref:Uncharacterized protein n=1 Tax=Eretmocerus hayati TaxID=131215 RepID=A0ACC2PBW5_9HYME|nr:hypothetical protein QAD02_016902 [Eretmocerus hayati]
MITMMKAQNKFYKISLSQERTSLMMGILEAKSESQVLRKMMTMLDYFDTFNPFTRGKYLINLVIDVKMSLEQFFRQAWSKKFVDLAVVQWIRVDESEISTLNSKRTTDYEIFVSSYNPFSDSLKDEELSTCIEVFPDKMKNLHGYPLTVMVTYLDFLKELTDKKLSRSYVLGPSEKWVGTLMQVLNFSIHPKYDYSYGDALYLNISKKRTNNTVFPSFPLGHFRGDFFYPFSSGIQYFTRNYSDIPVFAMAKYYSSINFPFHRTFSFYLIRPYVKNTNISTFAIISFCVLAYTAWIFAIWARMLNFREQNWSFLNILTAQMGGSIEQRGPMRLSKMIFQMSIYIATFIVVTLGSDYMAQIFIQSRQDLPKIETLRELTASGINLTMQLDQYIQVPFFLLKDQTMLEIFVRAQTRKSSPGLHSCFDRPRSASSVFDVSVNLCISRGGRKILNNKVQVDEIKEPIYIQEIALSLGKPPSFIKYRFEYVFGRLLEGGLFADDRRLDYSVYPNLHSVPGNPMDVGIDDDDDAPFYQQILPILIVGYGLGIFALIGEWIWRCFIAKTEMGKLARAFYNYSRPNSARNSMWASRVVSPAFHLVEFSGSRLHRSRRLSRNVCPKSTLTPKIFLYPSDLPDTKISQSA